MNSQHFDKLLLTFLIIIFSVAAFRGFQVGSVGLETFGADAAKIFTGALITLITGSVLKKNGGAPGTQATPPNSIEGEKKSDVT